jgi:hypothetical protein
LLEQLRAAELKEPVERGHRPAAWMRELPTSVFLQIRQAPRLQCVSASPLKNRQTPEALPATPSTGEAPVSPGDSFQNLIESSLPNVPGMSAG